MTINAIQLNEKFARDPMATREDTSIYLAARVSISPHTLHSHKAEPA